ncbi:tail assembly protein [Achromobacter sp. 77]|uniref:tail assembly protein n=1 Tax=Achromobacter sp. 77 TaxID=2756133 RepID=UPI001D01F4FE|nr:tail assembly protein [Achromobacter sp. 77]UDG74214.1 tail assembly protein [Achromobacter sp. 77]
MDNQLRTIRLYGVLGTRFGRVHRLAVRSAAEAIQALCAILPGFEREMITSGDRGVRYAVFLGRSNIGEDRLEHAASDEEEIRFAPVIQGAKRGGVFQTILGAAMVAVGAAINYFSAGSMAAFGTSLMKMGAVVALGGVIQLASPTQTGLSTKDSPDNGASYNFNGAVNTTAQGNCVPVHYGEGWAGSAVVSAGIYAEDQA